ncbi:MAG: endonuclease/exonuclease/phosphatase family protein [Thermoguttaceae bacterium]|nr:endonuclease/exonuclease/phosphatase family protein [Thermoguttaceae bacterium]
MSRNRSASSHQSRPPLAVWSLLLLPALLLGYSYGWAAEEPEPAVQLRLTSYNIRHGRGMDGRIDLDRIARVISDTKPDLVALQEVDVQTRRSDGVDQAAAIGELTGLHHAFGKAIDFAGGQYGNAVLSRFEPAKVENLPLPGTPGEEARAALFITVQVERLDEPLTFISMHLHHRLQEDRMAQIEAIIAKAKALGHPAVLVGDLNAQPGSKEYELVTSYFTDLVPDDRQGTYSSTDPQRRIDYLLFHPGKRFQLVEYRVIPEEVASDHRPLRMTVRFSGLPH